MLENGELILKEDSFDVGKFLDVPSRSSTDDSSILTTQLDSILPGTEHLTSSIYVLKTVFEDREYAGGTCYFDISGFSSPEIIILSPNGGENINEGVSIKWTSQDYQGNTLLTDIYQKIDGGNWTLIVSDEKDDGEYFWNTTNLPRGKYNIKIVIKNSLLGYQNEDSSDGIS